MVKYKVNEQTFFEILSASDYRCAYCGIPLDTKAISPGFKVPRSLGGDDSLDNLVAACKVCSKLKGHRTVEEFRSAIFESISEMVDKAYDAYEKISSLLDEETDADVRHVLVSAKRMMKRKISTHAVTFFFEEEKIKVLPLVVPPNEPEVRQ